MADAEIISRREVYKGRIIELAVEQVRLPNGNECELEVIRHPGASAVVPVDEHGNVLLVRQYRHAAGGWLYEVPAGKRDGGEAPESCAAREVEEEAGVRPGKLTPMGWIWTTPGFTDERIWLFLATELTRTAPSLQPDEALSVESMPLDDAVTLASVGRLADAKSVCALLRAPHYLGELGIGVRL